MGFNWGGKKWRPANVPKGQPKINQSIEELLKPLSEKKWKGNVWGSQIMNVEKDGETPTPDVSPSPTPSVTPTPSLTPTPSAPCTPWSPSYISTEMWFDASDSGTITQSGGYISQWDDKSGNGRHATQSESAEQPQTGSTLNGLDTIYFNADRNFDIPSLTGLTDASVYIVGQKTGREDTWAVALTLQGGDTWTGFAEIWGFGDYESGSNYWGYYSNTPVPSSTELSQNTYYITSLLRDTSGPTVSYWLDGNPDGTGITITSSSVFSQSFIGTDQYGSEFEGNIAEIIVVSGVQSTSNRQTVEGYLAWKWGMESNLPVGHPYKNTEPCAPPPSPTPTMTPTASITPTPTLTPSPTPSPVVLTLNQSYQGGRIVYILQSGDTGYDANVQHGLIMTTTDTGGLNTLWGCQGTNITGTTESIGTGQANTTAIVNQCATAGIAARICDDLSSGGYSDWYLPSKDELFSINANYSAGLLSSLGFSDGDRYWTSSQYNSNQAWYQEICCFIASNTDNKNNNGYKVRAVRAF